MLKHSTGESLFFQVAGQASGQSVVGSIQGLFFAKQIDGQWVIAASRVTPSIAQKFLKR
jgi:hypothetical protein